MGFLEDYFIDPILTRGGYNPVNTVVYLIILLALCFLVIYPQLNKRKIKFDAAFGFALLGFIAWGSSMRILEDAQVLVRSANPLDLGFYFFTPGIWVLVGVTTIIALLLSQFLSNRIHQSENHVFAAIGWILAIPFLFWNFTHFQNAAGVGWVVGLWVLAFAIVWMVSRITKNDWFAKDRLSQLAYAGQSLDGFATFVAIKGFNFSEQHVVSAGILSVYPLLFPLIKICLVLVILKVLHDEKMDSNLKGFIKILLMIIGLAPGLRDALLLGVLGGTAMNPLF